MRESMKVSALALCLASPLAFGGADDDVPRNHPSTDPYTEGGKQELLDAAGYASMGGFEFATTTTGEIDDFMAVNDIRWVETEHFELGFALGPHKVKQAEKKKLRAELEKLAEKLPAVKPKAKVLDPWLRMHLYAQRLEEIWDMFVEIIQVEESAFPDGSKPWDLKGTYMGEGPYFGQKGKYEILILPNEASSVSFLNENFGLKVRQTQRWNIIDRDTLITVIHTGQGQLRDDSALHGHVCFNLAINFLDGYKHYSYESAIWLREGLAHFMERTLNPKHNSFDSSEGAVAEMTRKSDWRPEVKKLVQGKKAPRMAELINLKTYAELELDHHFTTWSIVDFFVTAHPEKFARFLAAMKGRVTKDGFPDTADYKGAHRDEFKNVFGWTYPQFDAAWQEWVLANY